MLPFSASSGSTSLTRPGLTAAPAVSSRMASAISDGVARAGRPSDRHWHQRNRQAAAHDAAPGEFQVARHAYAVAVQDQLLRDIR